MIKNKLISFLFVSSLLILGLLNPANSFDYFISFTLFTLFHTNFLLYFLSQTRSHEKKLFLLYLTFLLSGFIFIVFQKNDPLIPSLSIFLGLSLSFLLRTFNSGRVLLISVVLTFIVTSVINGGDVRKLISQEPEARTYFNDQLSFLRVAYLVESGEDHYSAQNRAFTEDGRSLSIPKEIWGWRLPTYSYVWAWLPGKAGLSTYWLFIALSVVFLIVTYKLSKLFLDANFAVLSSYLILPYFHFPARDVAFLEMEWWGLIFFTMGLYFILKKDYLWSTLLFTIALLFRELFAIPIITILLLMLLFKISRGVLSAMISLSIFIAFWCIHYYFVGKYIGWGIESLKPRYHPWGWFFLLQTLSYASWEYSLYNLRPFLLSFVSLIVLTTAGVFKRLLTLPLLIITLVPLSMSAAILKIGTPPYDDYWGVSYVPLILIANTILTFKARNLKNKL